MIRDALKQLDKPRHILLNTFRYLFGVITKRDLNRLLKKEEQNIINDLLTNGYFLKNCKVYCYKVIKTNRAHYKHYQISRDDALCIRSCCKELKKEVDASWPYLSLKELDNYILYISSTSAKQYMGKFINKKLSFLIKSYGLSYHDLIADMTYAAILAVYKCYPRFESAKHAENLMKHAIHNAGMGIIMHHTKSCRNALYKDEDGLFQHRMREISTISELPYYDNKELQELEQSFTELSKKMTKRAKQFMYLATGKYDLLFSHYLGMDNRDYLERNKYTSYLTKVREYMELDKKRVETFFSRLRRHL